MSRIIFRKDRVDKIYDVYERDSFCAEKSSKSAM